MGTKQEADLFLKAAVECKFTLIISNIVYQELAKYEASTTLLFAWLKPKLEVLQANDEDKRLALTLPTHAADAVHAAVAIRSDADFLLTQNIKDFIGIEGLDIKNLDSIDIK